MEKKLPENIIKILNNQFVENEFILFKNKHFVLVIDPKNKYDSFHYTAWYRINIPSLKFFDPKSIIAS